MPPGAVWFPLPLAFPWILSTETRPGHEQQGDGVSLWGCSVGALAGNALRLGAGCCLRRG